MPPNLHRAPANPPARSYSSSSSDDSTTPPADRSSLLSFFSSSEYTAVSDHPVHHHKLLPALPTSALEGYGRSKEYDPYFGKHEAEPLSYEPYSTIHPLTTTTKLAAALGSDNVPYTTEIDSLPCAGVRVAHGPLTGLLAWRMVVRTVPETARDRSSWWHKSADPTKKHYQRRSSYTPDSDAAVDLSRPAMTQYHSYASPHASAPTLELPWPATSTTSLPLRSAAAGHPHPRPASHLRHTTAGSTLSTDRGVIANFIVDTGLPYSLISRDTLCALGYPPERLPLPDHDPHAPGAEDDVRRLRAGDRPGVVEVSIQNVTTRVRIARPGEAGKLGVQFLKDAGASLSFAGDGVGPVLYFESSRCLSDVPRTITSLPSNPRGTKMTLPQRVRALFGLS